MAAVMMGVTEEDQGAVVPEYVGRDLSDPGRDGQSQKGRRLVNSEYWQ